MIAGRKKQVLTEKEAEIMHLLWKHGALSVREMLAHYPEPRPHFSTVSTLVRILEDKGYVGHEVTPAAFRYFAAKPMKEFREKSFSDLVKNYFNSSYTSAVSALVEEEKISVDELRGIIDMIENKNKK